MSSRSYSRSEIISFLTQSVNELQNMCGQFVSTEKIDTFVVRIKTMDMIAQQAFKYSIMVSYLNEPEYVAIAETLDNVYLHQSRIRLSHMANKYGKLVTGEYDAMRTTLDLIDERLKTVKIVCAKPRHNKRQKKSRENLRHIHIQEEEFNECGVGYVFERRLPRRRQSTLNPNAKEFVPAESQKKYTKFHKTIAESLKVINELNLETKTSKMDPHTILELQFERIRELFDFIKQNADYISTDQRFRTPMKNGYSFMQTCIRKCIDLQRNLIEKYEMIRNADRKYNPPTLRSAKIAVIDSVERTFAVMLRCYEENPVEKESIWELLQNIKKPDKSVSSSVSA
jgi:hypothetical protein